MSNVGGYPTRSFSESQKFFVLDPSTGTSSLVLGADIVEYITPIINGVAAETTRLSAESTDYDIGNIIQTSGALEIGDSLASVYLVVASGDGDFPMINGNELLVITGDDSIREQLISEVAGEGAALVSMESGPSVEVAVLDRVIRVTSISAMEAYSAPVGYVFSLNAGGRSGTFDVVSGDFSTELAADTLNGVYVGLADNPTATSKVARRRHGGEISSLHFGFDNQADSTTIVDEFFKLCSREVLPGVLENGIYTVDPLTLPSNLNIKARSPRQAKLINLNSDLTGATAGSLEIIIASSKENIKFSGVVFDGNKDGRNPSDGPGSVHSLVDFTDCSNVRFLDCVFTRHNTNPATVKGILSIAQCTDVKFKNCDITKGTVEGLSFFGGSIIEVDTCYFNGTDNTGITYMSSAILFLEYPTDYTWKNCTIENTAGSGSNNTGANAKILNNTLKNIGSNGIDTGEGAPSVNRDFLIHGNYIDDFTKSGIAWSGIRGKISNNTIRDGDRGILIGGDTGVNAGAIVTGNHIENIYAKRTGESNRGYGIFVLGSTAAGESTTGPIITGNTILAISLAGILIRNVKKLTISNNTIESASRGIWTPSNDTLLERFIISSNYIDTPSGPCISLDNGNATFVKGIVVGNMLTTASTYEVIINSDYEEKISLVSNTGRVTGKASAMLVSEENLDAQAERFPIQLGSNYLWVDSVGKLRIKTSAPISDTDGTVVGTQT